MNNDTTCFLDETTQPLNPPVNQNAPAQPSVTAQGSSCKKKSGKAADAAMYAAGGAVVGAAVGAGVTATASTTDTPVAEEEDTDEMTNETPTENTEETPTEDQVILANDEGVRYAHVDADNFNDAFAQAREQVGAGGVFEYDGRLYGTFTVDEWNAMSAEERSDYQSRVNEVAPSHHSVSGHTAAPQYASVSAHSAGVDPVTPVSHVVVAEDVPSNAEMISPDPVENEIHVLGVEAVQDADGQVMNVALLECQGDQALLIDVDDSGTMDILIHDDNRDHYIQENEVHDISGANIHVNDLLEAQAAQQGDGFYASYDDGMPDYINDADSMISV